MLKLILTVESISVSKLHLNFFFPDAPSVVIVLNNLTKFSYMYLTAVTDKEVKAKEASRGVNGSEGASPSVSIVAPVNSPNTISFTTTTEKENLTAVNENIQGRI